MKSFLSGFDWEALREGPVGTAFLALLGVGAALGAAAAVYAGVATLVERKVAGHIQARLGPMRVGPHGSLQWVADTIKLLFKEDLIPAEADGWLFRLAPYLVFGTSLACWAALPFLPGWSAASFSIGLFYVLAVSSVGVVGLLMAGWAGGSKWALFGAMRAAAQIVSYGVPLGLTLLGMAWIYGTLDLQEICRRQEAGIAFGVWEGRGGMWSWGILRHPPFTIAAFLVYFTAALAETNRTPFDIPEADSELVAGYHTEYSGLRFGFFFLAEYANMFLVSAIAATVFLGGWQSPFPDLGSAATGILGLLAGAVTGGILGRRKGAVVGSLIGLAGGILIGALENPLAGWLPASGREPAWWTVLRGAFWFLSKSLFLVFVMMWLRWTLPRYRVDQLMDLCWKKLTPVALVNLAAIGLLETRAEWKEFLRGLGGF